MKLNRRELLFGKRRFSEDENGATAIEYGLIAGLLALAIAVPLKSVGSELVWTFRCVRFDIMGWTHPGCE